MKDQQIEQICQNIDWQTMNPLMCRCVNKYLLLAFCQEEKTNSASSVVTGVSVREVGRWRSTKKRSRVMEQRVLLKYVLASFRDIK